MTWRTDGKLKPSTCRKPLRDVSNSGINIPPRKLNNGDDNNKSSVVEIKLNQQAETKEEEEVVKLLEVVNNHDPLHRLLFLHSDVSSLLRQIDEIVVEAVKVDIDNEKSEEINAFTNVLSEIQSSLKPWVLRLQKVLAIPSPDSDIQLGERSVGPSVINKNEEHEVDTPMPAMSTSLISPSPLVSWRATDFKAEVGKQLFALTPLPRSRTTLSKPLASVKPTCYNEVVSSIANKVPSLSLDEDNNPDNDNNDPKIGGNPAEKTSETEFLSPSKKSIGDDLSTVLMTPCLKNSPPLSCVLQEPCHPFSFRKIDQFHKSTPFPVGQKMICESSGSDSSFGEVSDKLGLKYPELIGIKPSNTIIHERKAFEESPAWIRSPPKCCTLMEPLNEKPAKDYSLLKSCTQKLTSTFNQQTSLVPPKHNSVYIHNQDEGNKKGNLVMVESTPMWKGCESVTKTGKKPGENTLKKELWTKFEAASSRNGFEFDFPETPQKGFLDRLEEAS